MHVRFAFSLSCEMKLDDSVSFRVHHLYSFRNVQIDKFWLVHANTDFDCQLFKKIKQWIQKITEHLFRALNNLCAFSNEICTKHEFWSYLWYSVTLKFVEICFNNSTLMHSWKITALKDLKLIYCTWNCTANIFWLEAGMLETPLKGIKWIVQFWEG